jgi:hypothetical protein
VQVSEKYDPSGVNEVLPYSMGLLPFVALVFVLGCAMGVGKAAVYKHIPEYFPHDVGAVGGLVGMLGGLGGFFLPPLFAYTTAWTGLPSATFFVPGQSLRSLPTGRSTRRSTSFSAIKSNFCPGTWLSTAATTRWTPSTPTGIRRSTASCSIACRA